MFFAAACFDDSIMLTSDLGGDRQAQAIAAFRLCARFIQAVESVKQPFKFSGLYESGTVAYAKGDLVTLPGERDINFTIRGGVFHRVINQDDRKLTKQAGIALNIQIRRNGRMELQITLVGKRAEGVPGKGECSL